MINIKFIENFQEESLAICLFVSENLELSNNAMVLDKKLNGLISKSLTCFDNFTGKFGQVKSLTAVSKNEALHQIFIIGIGKENELSEPKIEELGGVAINALNSSRTKDGFIESFALEKINQPKVAALLASGSTLGSYSFNKYYTTKKAEQLPVLEDIEIFTINSKDAKSEFESLKAVCEGVYQARNVISEPGNILYPESYSEIIREALEPLDVEIEVIGENEMKNLGMNALLGVGQGSTRESKLVVMRYYGASEKSAPVAFVGKGVTFDTGGISLKPSANMHEMKYDMAGSAAVFGTIMALAKRKAKVNAIGVVGLVENMPGGNAQRPGDVVKSMSSQTIEILDTDAEGRLVLADALWYTQEKFKPQFMVDLATLTGAITIALGSAYGGLYSNNDNLAEQLITAGKASGEELWRMPLHSIYEKMLHSEIADIANLSSPRGHAGSNTAAQFLQKFVNKTPWAHLDIASVANDSKGKPISPKGAVGFGVRLLNKLVKENYEE